MSGIAFSDGRRYEGGLRNGRPHGYGVMTFPHGARYEGEWKNGDLVITGESELPRGSTVH